MIDWMAELHRVNPYQSFPIDRFQFDGEGWGWESPIFDYVIATYRPARMVEVGTWKGMSAIRVAGLMKQYQIVNPQLMCVDTWLGSEEHWLNPHHQSAMRLRYGRPEFYDAFLANVIFSNAQDVIVPFPTDSKTAAKFFVEKQWQADVIYLDAGHGYRDVEDDLKNWWPILKPDGVLFGDDYNPDWPGVVRAADEFAERLGLKITTRFEGKFLLEKSPRVNASTPTQATGGNLPAPGLSRTKPGGSANLVAL